MLLHTKPHGGIYLYTFFILSLPQKLAVLKAIAISGFKM
tara:strand:+ start:1615 stop:1731 length:117 start_codon:yes stop_codon:yes gene_type:complete